MGIISRGWIALKRQPLKAGILFLIIFFLGSMVSVAVSVSQGITNTELNLLRRIPPVATVKHDGDALHEYNNIHGGIPTNFESSLPLDLLTEISNLPQVRAFDVAFVAHELFFSRELVLPMDITPYLEIDMIEENILRHLQSLSLGIDGKETFTLRGVYRPHMMDLEEGIIHLVRGRVFTEGEVREGKQVAIISEAFAKANNMGVGSMFILDQSIYDSDTWFNDDSIIISEPIELEVIGVFAPTMRMGSDTNWIEFYNHVDLSARIYVPMDVAKQPLRLWREYLLEINSPLAAYFESFFYQDAVFALHEPLYLGDFCLVASELLPEFWMVYDLRYEFASMSGSLEVMQTIAMWIMVGAVGATLTVLGLLIILFLRDRNKELGIYLALGESKRNIVLQMIFEVVLVSILATTFSLYVGNMFADYSSQIMLRQDLIYNGDVFPNQDMYAFNDFNRMGFGVQMTAEEMMDAYSMSLNASTIGLFYMVSLLIIVFSTLVSSTYYIRFSPKKILLQ